MVSGKVQNGKMILTSCIPISKNVAEKIKAVIKSEKKVVVSMLEDLHIDHWLETNGNETLSVASKKFSNKEEIDVLIEVDILQKNHQELIKTLASMELEKSMSQPEETTDVPDKEAEEFLNYALVCKLQELIDSCSAIIIAIPK